MRCYSPFVLLALALGCQRLPVIERFEAVPPEITAGESTVLVWQVRNADSVEIAGVATGLGERGSLRQRLFSGQYYVLRAYRGESSAERLTSVVVHPRWGQEPGDTLPLPQRVTSRSQATEPPVVRRQAPTIRFFRIVPSEPMEGERVLIQWDVEDADSVELVGIAKSLGSVGNMWYPVSLGQVFILRAYGGGSYVERTLVPVVRSRTNEQERPIVKGAPAEPEEPTPVEPESSRTPEFRMREVREPEPRYVVELRTRYGAVTIQVAPPYRPSLEKLVQVLQQLLNSADFDTTLPQRTVARFGLNSTTVPPTFHPVLMEWARYLREHPDVRVEIQGHSDLTGTERLNQRLSQERAEQVRRLLIAYGVSPTQVVARGYGSTRPLWNPEVYEWQRAENRRVEIVILP